MKFNLKDLRELVHDCFPESKLEEYVDEGIAELREMLKTAEQQGKRGWYVSVHTIKEILGGK